MNLNKSINNLKDEIIKHTQEIVRIKSVEEAPIKDMPFGEGVDKALNYALGLCDNLGFKTKNIDNQVGYAEIGSGEEMIGILVHLDVVPEGDLDTWKHHPYKAIIDENKIYGRGTIDDKGPAIAAIYAMKVLKDNLENINKRIRIIFGLNEETSWKSINYYLKDQEIPNIAFTPDADFPVIHGEKGILIFNLEESFTDALNDGGIKILSIKGGNRPNMVPDYTEVKLIENKPFKHILDAYVKENNINIKYEKNDENNHVTLKAYGKSAHGASPELGINSISHIIKFLSLVDLEIGDLSNFIRFYSTHIGTEINGENFQCAFEDKASGKLTFNVGTINLDTTNVELGVNVRYPISFDDKKVYNAINKVLKTSVYNSHGKITLNPIKHQKPIYFEKDHPLIKTLMGVYNKHTNDNLEPITIGGGTYARSMPNAVAFGALFENRKDTAHQANEHIYIDDLILSTKIYADSLKELLK